MGLFWDLIQQSQISNQRERSADLASRVAILENELLRTRQTLHTLLLVLEQHLGQDLDGNGQVGN